MKKKSRGRPRETVGCSVDGCDRIHHGKGFCKPHYYRVKRTGIPGCAAVQSRSANVGSCSVECCDNPSITRGYCNAHYLRSLKGRPLNSQVRNRARNGAGSRWVNRCGYVVITLPGEKGRKMEHRLIMERTIGRDLLKGETVHHINGIKEDNRPENLELWCGSHPAGQKIPDLVDWAKEILNRYGNTGWAAK